MFVNKILTLITNILQIQKQAIGFSDVRVWIEYLFALIVSISSRSSRQKSSNPTFKYEMLISLNERKYSDGKKIGSKSSRSIVSTFEILINGLMK